MSRTRSAVVGAGLAGAATAWQLMRRGAVFDGEVLHHPDAGVLDAGRAVRSMAARASQLGADVRQGWPVARVERHHDGYRVSSAAGHPPVRADVVLVTAGPWLGELIAALPLDAPGCRR